MCTQACVFSFLSVRGHWRERRGHGRDLVRLQRRLQQQDVRHQGHPGRVQQRQRVSNGSEPQACNRGTFFVCGEAQTMEQSMLLLLLLLLLFLGELL